ncbi:MAG: apolipoprotein N-acyltransferase [Synechococcaceae cyanobacterium]|nr:apolipoprotein N-acyltransferase [Synechococcaceae cyanobacterium]
MTVPSVDGSQLRAALWALVAGSLAGLALPPLGQPLLLWPALAVLWQLVNSGQRGSILLWGLAALLTSHRWLLWLHPLDWIGVPAPLSLPLCLLIWLACGLVGGALILIWSLPWRKLGLERADTALLAAGLWGLAEVLLARGPLFWIGLGVSPLPSDRPLAGLGALGGAGLIATVQLLIGWGLWRALLQGQQWRHPWPSPWHRKLVGWVALIVSAHLLGAAALMPAQALSASTGEPETLLVIQPAIPTRQKFEPAQQRRLLGALALTLERLSAGGSTAMPSAARIASPVGSDGLAMAASLPSATGTSPLDTNPSHFAAIAAVLLPEGALPLDQPLPRRAPVEVLSGGFRRHGESLRSALLRFQPGERWPAGGVDKHRLVPLGEWVPLSGLVRWSGLSAVGGLEPGAAPRLLNRPGGPIGVAICYEVADGQALAQASRDGAQWLLASANLDPYPLMLQQQYAAVAQLRSIETGRWLVSAANTGPSLLVDPAGRLRSNLAPQVFGEGIVEVRRLQKLSVYGRLGERPLLVLLGVAAACRAGIPQRWMGRSRNGLS